jgi:hypothetical protein
MWIDIGVTLLLTLRIARLDWHFRSYWIRIMMPGYRREKMNSRSASSLVMEK